MFTLKDRTPIMKMERQSGRHVNVRCWMKCKTELCTQTVTVSRLDNFESSYHFYSCSASCTYDKSLQYVEKDESSRTDFP